MMWAEVPAASCGLDGTLDIHTRCVRLCDLCVISCWNFGVVLGCTIMAARHSSFCLGCCVSYLLGLIMEAVFQVAEVKDRRPSSLPHHHPPVPAVTSADSFCLPLTCIWNERQGPFWRPTSWRECRQTPQERSLSASTVWSWEGKEARRLAKQREARESMSQVTRWRDVNTIRLPSGYLRHSRTLNIQYPPLLHYWGGGEIGLH